MTPHGTIPIEALLADQTSSRGQGIETTLVHTWPWPAWVALLLLILSAACVAATYMRETAEAGARVKAVLAAARIALVGLVVLMMYGWTKLRYRTDLPDVAVMLDVSASMGREGLSDDDRQREWDRRLQAAGLQKATRLNLAKTLLLESGGDMVKLLEQSYNVKLYLVGDRTRLLEAPGESAREKIRKLEAQDPASRLGAGVLEVLEAQRGRPTAAVLLFTDGVTTEGELLSTAAEQARRKAVPLFVVGLGGDKPSRDVQLSDLLVEQAALVGDLLNFEFRLTSAGCQDRSVVVRLTRKGDPAVLAEKTIPLPPDGQAATARLSHRPQEKGDFQYVVQALPLEGEANLENNQQSRLVQVRDETLRALLVQEYPSYEFRYLKTLLERGLKPTGPAGEKAVELTTVLQEADPGYAELDKTARRVFPVSRDELFHYDVILFGDVNPSFLSLSVMNNIADFVIERGGGLIVIAGPRHTPLAYRGTPLDKLMPIQLAAASAPDPDLPLEKPFVVRLARLGIVSPQMQLEDEGAANQQAWERLPGLYWLLQAPDLKPGARVLAEHPTLVGHDGRPLPAICLQFIGAGKVLLHLIDETYRWSRSREGDAHYARYWLQTIRYLSRSRLIGANRPVEMTTDRETYVRGEPVRLRVRFLDDRLAPPLDDGVTIVLEHEAGGSRRIKLRRESTSPGVFTTVVSDLGDGQYRAWIASPTLSGKPPSQSFTVASPPGEMARLEMDAAELRLAAKISQGRFYTVENAHRLKHQLPRGRQVRIESLPPKPVWNSPWLAAAFVALIIGEWLLRKKAGLV